MKFDILPLSNDNPDSVIISLIEERGIQVFTNYYDIIQEKGNENDNFYYSYYLQWVLFNSGKWKELVSSLYENKKYIGLIDFIENDSLKREFVKRIVKLYKREDISDIVLHDKVLSYFDIEETKLLTILLNSNRIQLNPFLRCSETREGAMKWIYAYYNNNLRFKSLTLINVIDMYGIDKKFTELIKITEQLIDIFSKEVTPEEIQNFKAVEEYFNDDSITFHNKLFLMIHNFYELSVINLLEFRKYLGRTVIELKDEIDNEEFYDDSYDINFTLLKLEFYEQMLDKLDKVTFDQTQYSNFYRYDTIIWLSHTKQGNSSVNNILETTLSVLFEESLEMDDDIFNVLLRIIQVDNSITKSLAMKLKAALILSSYYEPIATGVKQRILLNINTFVLGMVSLYNDLTDFDDFNIYLYYQQILHLLRDYKDSIYKINDQECVEKFIYTLLTNYFSFYKGYINSLYTANKIMNGESDNYDSIDPIKPMIEWYQKEIFLMDEFIIMGDFLERATCVGNRDKLAMVIGFKINAFAGDKRSQLKINIANKYFKPLVHMMSIYYILDMLKINDAFIDALVNEVINIKTEYVTKILNILVKKKQISDLDRGILLPVLDKINHQRENETQELENIPEELLDPIMGTLIKRPIILPNSNTLMDYDVIMRHLMEQSNNPFTREELTKTQLVEFNERPDIQERLAEFKQRLLESRKT